MEIKTYADPLQCNLKLSGPNRLALIRRLTEANRVDHTAFARELLESQLLNTPTPEPVTNTISPGKEFPAPLQCNLKLTGALREAVIQRLTDAGRTDHTTFVREVFESILGTAPTFDHAPKVETDEPAPVAQLVSSQDIDSFMKEAKLQIDAAVQAAADKMATIDAEFRKSVAEAAQVQPAPDHSTEIESFIQTARETFDIVLTQGTAKLANLEDELRKTVGQVNLSPQPVVNLELEQRLSSLETTVREARNELEQTATTSTKNIKSFEDEVREALRGIQAHTPPDHSEEIAAFLRTARENFDSALTESVEKVAATDNELRTKLDGLQELERQIKDEASRAKSVLEKIVARPPSHEILGLTDRQKAVEAKLAEVQSVTRKLGEELAAERAKAKAPQPPKPAQFNWLPTVLAATSLVGVVAVGLMVWLQPPSPALDLSEVEAAIAAFEKRIDGDELTFAKELSELRRELNTLKPATPITPQRKQGSTGKP